MGKYADNGYDAIVVMGNSFAHLPDFHGDQQEHKIAIANFHALLKPGGVLIIDHRNYDYILENGAAPKKNIYYNVRPHVYRKCTELVILLKHVSLFRANTSKASRPQSFT